jgi:acetyl-CoA carboxylase alpha subunit
MGRNPYSKAMFITIEDIDDEQISQELVDEIEQKGNEWIREKAAELGKQLDSEWDHMNSEESAQDYYENMDTRFNSDGTEI